MPHPTRDQNYPRSKLPCMAAQRHSALGLRRGHPPFFACLRLTPWPPLYINLSRYCDEKRKTVKIRCGRATVIGTNPRRTTVHRPADNKLGMHIRNIGLLRGREGTATRNHKRAGAGSQETPHHLPPSGGKAVLSRVQANARSGVGAPGQSRAAFPCRASVRIASVL